MNETIKVTAAAEDEIYLEKIQMDGVQKMLDQKYQALEKKMLGTGIITENEEFAKDLLFDYMYNYTDGELSFGEYVDTIVK